jgi:hypothetical protein
MDWSPDVPQSPKLLSSSDLHPDRDKHLRRAFSTLGSRVSASPSVSSPQPYTDLLFTSIAMSARADWQSAPISMRGVAARGWFLGRWIPTFLVLDGPILRFLTSEAFRRHWLRQSMRSSCRVAQRSVDLTTACRHDRAACN